jgi:hypothetical protein
MDYAYPPEFPAAARAMVAAKKIVAAREFAEKRQGLRRDAEVEVALRVYILQVFLSFAEGAFELGRQGVWSIDQVEEQAREFLRRTAIEANAEMGFDRAGHQLSPMFGKWGGHILPETQQKLEKTPEWKQYTDGLLDLAKLQAGAALSSSDSGEIPSVPDSGPSESADLPAITVESGPDHREPHAAGVVKGQRAMLNVDLINQWMIKEEYSGKELAEKLNVQLRTITSLRRNQKNHGRKVVQRLANLMGLDVMDLYL